MSDLQRASEALQATVRRTVFKDGSALLEYYWQRHDLWVPFGTIGDAEEAAPRPIRSHHETRLARPQRPG